MWLKKVLAELSLALVISLSQCTGACWEFALEPIKLPFILSGVCSPSEANYCSNPFEVFLYSLRSMPIQSKYVVPYIIHTHASYWKKARLFKYYNPLTDGKHQNSRCWCKNSLIFQKKGLYYLCHNSIYYNSKEWCHKKRFRDTYLLISPRQSAWQNIYHKAKNARLQNFFLLFFVNNNI